MQPLSQAFRSVVRRRSYGGLTLALITLATTATSATFAVVGATLWRQLPFRDPDALVNIYTTEPVNRDSTQQLASSAMMLARWRDNARTLSGVEGYSPVNVSVAGDGNPEALSGAAVSAGLFDLLGTSPAAGRSFRREEEGPSSGVIIVGDDVARRRFGSPGGALGKTLVVDGEPRTVIGVMPAGFSLLFQGGDAWVPLDLSMEQQTKVGLRNIAVFARRKPGASITQATADVGAIQREIAAAAPSAYAATRVAIRTIRERLFGDRRPTMYVLTAAVVLLVLIAIVNVANLSLADALSRRTLTMTRVALGARATALIAARLTETAILVGASALLALPLAGGILALLASMSPEAFAPLGNRWIDGTTLAATLLTAAVVGFIGAVPAVVLEARTRASGIAGGVAKSGGAAGDRRMQAVLAALQSVVTVVLLTIAVLLGRDLARLLTTRTGFVTDGVIVVRMNVLSRERSTVPSRARYADDLVRAVSAVPGVVDVSAIQSRFVLNETMQSAIDVDGFVAAPGQRPFSQIRHVMPNAFRVLGVRTLAGRGIDSTDRPDSRLVAVINNSFAKTYWPGASAIGKRLRRGGPGAPWLDVVGVVEDVMDAGLGVPLGPTFFVPYLQQNTATARVTLVARTRAPASTLLDGIRRAVWSVSPSQAIDDIVPLPTLMNRTVAQPRFRASIVGVFSTSAVILVLAGVYATTLFNVLSRRRELGIRAAIGASPGSLAWLATRRSLNPVLIGGLIGGALTLPAAAMMRTVIQSRMSVNDLAMSFAAVVALLMVAGVTALIPAGRAARISPAAVVREG